MPVKKNLLLKVYVCQPQQLSVIMFSQHLQIVTMYKYESAVFVSFLLMLLIVCMVISGLCVCYFFRSGGLYVNCKLLEFVFLRIAYSVGGDFI